MSEYIFTSESVSEGHPDKICDQISDAILDAHIARDPEARVACETMATTNSITLAGEMRSKAPLTKAEIDAVVRGVVKNIGYEQEGFHWQTLDITNRLHEQSADIAMGVDEGEEKQEGAGDQGIMFGYACNETNRLMPAPLYYAHKVLWRLSEKRHKGETHILGPDAKSQISVRYRDGKPEKATAIVLSTQHIESATKAQIEEVARAAIQESLPEGWIDSETKFFINPTGRFVIGGPDGDAGLTGRKIIVDTYGGAAPHGGGAFSGKDPTKVDRSAAYISRYLAKNVVAAGLAERCIIQLSYAIGIAEPTSVWVNTKGTGKVEEEKISSALRDLVDLTPKGIRLHLGLNKAIYQKTASYGHFGRDPEEDGSFSWEKTDLVEALKKSV